MTITVIELIESCPLGMLTQVDVRRYRVHAVHEHGSVVDSSTWPTVATLREARDQLDALRADPANARYDRWYVLRVEPLVCTTIVADDVRDDDRDYVPRESR